MELDHARTEGILEILAQKGECELDELVLSCPRFTWNQIFLEVDRLSREDDLTILLAHGTRTIRMCSFDARIRGSTRPPPEKETSKLGRIVCISLDTRSGRPSSPPSRENMEEQRSLDARN